MIFVWFYDVIFLILVDLCGFCYDCYFVGISVVIIVLVGVVLQVSWQECLKVWEEFLLKDKLKEMVEEDDVKYEVIVNFYELGVNELEEQYLQVF